MGNQTFCNCIAVRRKNETLHVENENSIQCNEKIYDKDFTKLHLMEKHNNYSKFKKSVSSKIFDFPEINQYDEKRRYSFQSPDISFVTIHMKPSKKNMN
jgi:hypothetical protein